MELFSTEFFSALVAIIIIDLVLAGDNAIVIALAARSLPEHLRKRAVVWGTVGAIVVRSAMTIVVVWLLKIPGLLLIGGALLLWIAYKLLLDQDEGEGGHNVVATTTFWGAMKTIIIADAVMGLDNVLAVAGAAHGSFLLVVLGLLISIPIVIWGSQLILKFVQRYPSIVYIGAAVLLWTSVKMMMSEPLIKDYVEPLGAASVLVYVVFIGGVLFAGFWANHAATRTRVAAHLVDAVVTPLATQAADGTPVPAVNPHRVLVPIDGSGYALQAVQHVVNRAAITPGLDVHLLHVRTPLSKHVAWFVNKDNREGWHRDMAARAMRAARDLLDSRRIAYTVHVDVGARADVIAREAERLQVDRIVMGTARKNSLTRMVEDSVSSKVLDRSPVPVEIVAGETTSPIERVGVPAGIAAALAVIVTSAV
jgi:YjbE family integral membrane protein